MCLIHHSAVQVTHHADKLSTSLQPTAPHLTLGRTTCGGAPFPSADPFALTAACMASKLFPAFRCCHSLSMPPPMDPTTAIIVSPVNAATSHLRAASPRLNARHSDAGAALRQKHSSSSTTVKVCLNMAVTVCLHVNAESGIVLLVEHKHARASQLQRCNGLKHMDPPGTHMWGRSSHRLLILELHMSMCVILQQGGVPLALFTPPSHHLHLISNCQND